MSEAMVAAAAVWCSAWGVVYVALVAKRVLTRFVGGA